MVIASILPHTEFGSNDGLEDAPHFINEDIFGSHKELNLVDAEKIAASNDFEIKAFSMVENVSKEQSRSRNIVRIGLIQNKIHADTSAPVQDQFMAIYNRIEKMIDAAGAAGVNVLCLQEAWTMPFAFCTREKQPWMEFAECAQTGQRFVPARASRTVSGFQSPQTS